jgi:hypothetical protein
MKFLARFYVNSYTWHEIILDISPLLELTHSDPPTPLKRGSPAPLRVPRLPQWRGFRRSPFFKGG